MAEYKSCMGSAGVDPREKYDVIGNVIHIYRRPDKIFISLRKWNLKETFTFNQETRVDIQHMKDEGSGRIQLENKNDSKYDFFVYGELEEFLNELSRNGLRPENTKF